MSERFSIEELEGLSGLLGYRMQRIPTSDDCCYQLEPTEAAAFHEAHLDVPPVEKQQLTEWELYSKLAFAIERFVAELMGKVREGIRNPEVFTNGQTLQELARYVGLPVEYMQPHLNWSGAFMLADKLMAKAKALHAAQLVIAKQKRNPS